MLIFLPDLLKCSIIFRKASKWYILPSDELIIYIPENTPLSPLSSRLISFRPSAGTQPRYLISSALKSVGISLTLSHL